MHNTQGRLSIAIFLAATLIAPTKSYGQQTQVPYHFKESLKDVRPGHFPEQPQMQAPARLEFSKSQASGLYVAELQQTRVDLLEKKIDLLEKRLIELESRKK